jgi:hypothetical protein
MSSYLSSEYRIQQPVSPGDINLDMKILSTMQGQYDTNKAKIDQTLAVYNNQLRGLRAEDNEYIANRLNEVDSVIEQYKKKNGNLAYNSTTDTILSTVKSLMDDPIIKDAVKNKAYFDNYEKQVQELKKKSPEKYSDINYQDELEQKGYYKYLKGEVKSIGNLQYKEYTNVQKDLNDAVGKWAKDNGYQTKINSINKGLYYENVKSEVLTKDEIVNYIDTLVDPKTKAQMDINARASYGRMDDESFNKVARLNYEQENKKDANTTAELKAMLKTTVTKEQEAAINERITTLESRSKERTDKISSGKYDRNDQYKFYKDALYGGIAEAYDRDNIIDIDYNTVELDIAKFKFDMEYKTEDLKLKKEANRLKEEENKITAGASDGTAIPVIPEEGEAPKSNISLVKTAFTQSEAELKSILASEDPQYRELKSLEERNKYVRTLMSTGGTINVGGTKTPLSSNILVAINNHKNNYQAYSAYVNTAKKGLDSIAQNQYDDMAGAKGLDLNNLSSSMPFTAEFLKSKRAFKNLRPEEQEMVRYERALNQIQFDDNLEDDDKEATKTYLNHIKTRNSGNKWFQEGVKKLGDAEEVGGFWSNVGNTLGLVGNILPMGYMTLKRNLDYLPNKWIGGAKYADENYDEQLKTGKEFRNWNVSASDKIGKFVGDYFNPSEDTNITEVDRASDTKSGRDLSQTYRKTIQDAVINSNKELGKFLPTIPEKQTFSFSTEDKAQKAMAVQLGQLVQKHGGDVPDKGENNFNLEYFAQNNAFKITYLDKDGEAKTTDFIDKALVPKNIVNKYQTSLSNWSTDLKNPKAVIPSMTYVRPASREDGEKALQIMAETNPGVFSDQELYMLMDSPMFQTPSITYEKIYEKNPTIKGDKEKEAKVDSLMNSTIRTRTRRYDESTFQIQNIFVDKNGREIATSKWESIGRYDPQNNLKIQLMKIAADFDTQINIIAQ